mmetsp:Transcript_22975/g.51247  ORF Transcript_22975/g.51247 Transcript_22975/m.51247 type:complete len:144 (-) Transcript_22975:328-759(-)
MKVEDIAYDASVPEKPASPGEGQKPKAVSRGKDDTTTPKSKTKSNDGKAKKPSGSASKKRKTTTNEKSSPKRTSNAKKKKTNDGDGKASESSSSSSSRSNGKKDNPKKDACAGMKNLMAQFVKRSPAKQETPVSKDPENPSSQ